jgi:Xaa-Pro dipeptidase
MSSDSIGNSFFSMGRETFKVPVEDLFVANRRRLLQKLRQKDAGENEKGPAANNASLWWICLQKLVYFFDITAKRGVIYLQGGPSQERFDTDHEPIFRQESYFLYLTGVKEPDVHVMLDIVSQHTTLFIPRLPSEYATVMGRIRTPLEWKQQYLVDDVRYSDEVISLLETMLLGVNGNHQSCIMLMRGQNSDSGNMYEPPAHILAKFPSEVVDTDTLFPILADCRVFKSPTEMQLIRHVTEVTSFAHVFTMQHMKPDMMEYQGESLFRHYCYYNYGCRLVGYTPICGCGPNAAILHYGHTGEPNARQIKAGDMCLFDMGAEYCGYGSDVTCSFPIDGVFATDEQKTIYSAVLNAQVAVYDMIRPGISYMDCHKKAEACIIQGLVDLGVVNLINESIEDLVERRLGAVFMPHGLGHLIGIDTHDVGGYLDGTPSRSALPGLAKLRTARILEPNMTLTVEPGCYFIDHLLDEALKDDSPLRPFLNLSMVEKMRGFGGVRLEDVVVVTEDGCINYTLCPRTIEEVEAVMAGAKWPPKNDVAPELRRERLTNPNPLPPLPPTSL